LSGAADRVIALKFHPGACACVGILLAAVNTFPFIFFVEIPVGSRFSFAFNLKITLGNPHTRRKKNLSNDVIWRRFQRGLVNERAEGGNSFAAEGKESLRMTSKVVFFLVCVFHQRVRIWNGERKGN
jgi:hypothetical protein